MKYANEVIQTIQAFVDKHYNGVSPDTSSGASDTKDTGSDLDVG